MISDVKTTHDFRHIQKLAYQARESINENPLLLKELLSSQETKDSNIEVHKAFIKFQTGFIEK